MSFRTTLIASSLIAASLVSGAAKAALVDRGGGLIYDTDLNVTWLQDANYAKTSSDRFRPEAVIDLLEMDV